MSADPALIAVLGRIADALERLAPPGPIPTPPELCVRCAGLGYLGAPQINCHACDGSGQQPS